MSSKTGNLGNCVESDQGKKFVLTKKGQDNETLPKS